ncbi:recombination mediator RecR, partial [Helicobacter pylori]
SESEVCEICSDESRQNSQLCMVLHPRDVFILEDLKDFLGRYYVLNSIEEVDFNALEKRLVGENIKEIIFAFPPTLANDSLMLYIEDKLQHLHLTFTKIAQGVPTGVNFENIDSVSLSRAFNSRIKA